MTAANLQIESAVAPLPVGGRHRVKPAIVHFRADAAATLIASGTLDMTAYEPIRRRMGASQTKPAAKDVAPGSCCKE